MEHDLAPCTNSAHQHAIFGSDDLCHRRNPQDIARRSPRTAESALCHFHNFDMPRHLIIVALLLSMLMQATAFGSSTADVGGGQAALHSLLHWAGLGHHHHRRPARTSNTDLAESNAGEALRVSAVADSAWNTYHQDQSPESIQHLLLDDGYISSAAMIPSWPDAVPAELPRPTPLCYDTERVPATPFLEGLRRPPRLLA